MSPTTTFVPSGTPTTITPNQYFGATFNLPAPDGSNVDLTVQNTGVTPAWVSFAAGAPVGGNVPGNLFVPGGATVLCTSNAITLAAAAADPPVANPQNGAYATAAQCSAIVQQQGGTLVFTRGTATARGTW